MANENDGKPWSDDDLQQLKTMITENTPTGLIAMKLGRTEDSVRDKVARRACRWPRQTRAREIKPWQTTIGSPRRT
jgi:hypothetical protein